MIFNFDEALARCLNQRQMLLEMIDFFCNDSAEIMSAIQSALAQGDAAAMGRAAHRLKGTVAYLGAQPTMEAARSLERMGLNLDLAGAGEAAERLAREVESLRDASAPYQTNASVTEPQ